MPDVRPVISRVVPEGTLMPSRTIVAHEVFDLLATEASVNVHDARLAKAAAFRISGAAVGIGTADTRTAAVLRASPEVLRNRTILKRLQILGFA